MMEVVIHVEAPMYMARGVAEDLAMAAREWGPSRVVSVRDTARDTDTKTGGNSNGNV
ncbi:MAG: hypothetical protein IJR48_04070 [Oscillibacter sp.]|nr:hypothetical protein [Oscillibacter sp.]MBQ9617521.1 hypothetical protein [Oscillibacter sp.]